MYDRDTKRAAISAADVVMATVKKAGAAGAPLGPIYAALQEHFDCSYSQFEALINKLEGIGCIRRTADLAFYIPGPLAASTSAHRHAHASRQRAA
jgi:hypothetical protein